MDARTAATLQLIAKAFASSSTRYSVTVSAHPTVENAYEVIFSLLTAEAPESPAFVKLTLTEVPSEQEEVRHFEGKVEHQRWPISISIDAAGALLNFPQSCIDVAWEQKQVVGQRALWAL